MPVRAGDFAVWINHTDDPELVVAKTISPSGKSMIVRREDGSERIVQPKKVLTLKQAVNRGIKLTERPQEGDTAHEIHLAVQDEAQPY